MTRTIIRLLFVLLVISACGIFSPPPAPTPTLENTPTTLPTFTPLPPTETATLVPSPTFTPAPERYGPDNFPAQVNPLSGLIVADATVLERRPVSVKIQNFPRTDRPPYGLSYADIVYDYYQNNGLTRFNAIFYSQDIEQAGPVRSGRLLDGAITQMYKTYFAFGGADKKILNKYFNSDYYNRLVVEGPSNCPPMCRFDPNGLNYLILNTKEVGPFMAAKGMANTRQDLNGMLFEFLPPNGGTPAPQLSMRYSISAYLRWDYDPATGRYLRFQDTNEAMDEQSETLEPLIDRLNNLQIMADNVVVLLVSHEYFYKSGNSEVIDIKLSGKGKAFAFRDGQVYELLWNRPTNDSVLYLTYPDGTPFPLKHGITWFQPVGATAVVRVSEDNIWRFEMRFP